MTERAALAGRNGVPESGSGDSPTWAAGTPITSRPVRNLLLYVWAFLAIGTAIAAWSIATPLMAAPDEPSHAIDAAAVVRGMFDVREHPTTFGLLANVRVPEWVASTRGLPSCFSFKPTVSAGCSPKVSQGTAMVGADTQFSNYPPLYYLLVGIPSLVAKGTNAVYAMRMVGTLMNGALIALGLFLLARYHPRRGPLVGALVALSPMVFFVTSVLNSSGMEIAAAFAAWCGGLCVIESRRVPAGLAGWTSLAFVVLVLSRPISPINAGVIILALATLAGWSRCKELARDRSTLAIRLSLLGGIVVAGIFLLIGGVPGLLGIPNKPRLSLEQSIWLTLRLSELRLRQSIGEFGWLDTPVPEAVFALWVAAVAFVTALGLSLSARCRRALPVLVIGIVAMPIILESPRIDAVGPYWQGRYWLPLLIGIPLLATSLPPPARGGHGRRRRSFRLRPLPILALGLPLAAAQVWAFLTALHRYEYGLGSGPRTVAKWTPPGGAVLVTGMFSLGLILLLGFVVLNCTAQEKWPLGDPCNDLDRRINSNVQRSSRVGVAQNR